MWLLLLLPVLLSRFQVLRLLLSQVLCSAYRWAISSSLAVLTLSHVASLCLRLPDSASSSLILPPPDFCAAAFASEELSANAQAALAEFLTQKNTDDAQSVAEMAEIDSVPSIDAFKEDWGLSQFWYCCVVVMSLRDVTA